MLDFLLNTHICDDQKTLFIFQIARWVILIIQIAVPFVLIIWGSIDFFKAVIAGDEKEMKQKRKPFVQRVVAALIIILLPTIVNLILKNIASNTNNKFATCWSSAAPGDDITIPNDDDDWDTE